MNLISYFRVSSSILLLALVTGFTANASDLTDKQLEVVKAVVFIPAHNSRATGSRMTLINHLDQIITLESVKCDRFAKVMFHQVHYEHGQPVMTAKPSLQIPAHGKLALTPNKDHLMLMGPKSSLQSGELLKLSITTNVGSRDVIAQVVPFHLK